MSRKIYLDYNASTPICPEAVEAMRPFLFQHYGNPSSLHWIGMPQAHALRDRFWEGLRGFFGEKVTLNGHPTARLPNTLNVNFVGRGVNPSRSPTAV